MQFIKTILTLILFIVSAETFSQSSNLPLRYKHDQLLDRLEIKMQSSEDLNLSTAKPLSRRWSVRGVEYADSVGKANPGLLSSIDEHNIRSFYMNNSEWYSGDATDFTSKKDLFNTFYKTQANMIEVNNPDFFLAVNPVIQFNGAKEQDYETTLFLNQKGINFRGLIARRVGFSGMITDNQERAPLFVQDYANNVRAVPGFGFYKRYKNSGWDYFDARGSIHFNAAKFIDFTFGYDKNFIGNGYRSLFLSDFSNSNLFLRINTRIWKLNYQAYTMELIPQFTRTSDTLRDKKYAAVHHLSVNATKWLTIGLFESIVYGRKNRLELSYLNPVIFLRNAESQNGSEDNAIVGFDVKANVAKTIQLYSQIALDEFKLDELTGGNGWWANKFGIQAGLKYIDAFKIKNLDLQGELNMVRPFTYTHKDTVANFTNYNQPMAHPLGANFREFIGIIRYQPHAKWYTSARLIFWQQGIDTAGVNNGNSVFKPYTTRANDYGYTLPTGPVAKGLNAQFLVTWEPKENLFLDVSALIRRFDAQNVQRNTTVITAGLRMNIARREYDY